MRRPISNAVPAGILSPSLTNIPSSMPFSSIRRRGVASYCALPTSAAREVQLDSTDGATKRRKVKLFLPVISNLSNLKFFALASITITLLLLYLTSPHPKALSKPSAAVASNNNYGRMQRDFHQGLQLPLITSSYFLTDSSTATRVSEFDQSLAKAIVGARLGVRKVQINDEFFHRRKTTQLTIVISHCEDKLNWIPRYVGNDYKIKQFIIYSKCGKEIKGISSLQILAPVQVIQLDNVGRCDHTYAYWIKTHYRDIQHKFNNNYSNNDMVLFMKDNKRYRNMYRKIDDVFDYTTSTGFACFKKPECDCQRACTKGRWSPTMMHNRTYLLDFSLHEYSRIERDENSQFLNERYNSLKIYTEEMGFHMTKAKTMPVCYLGLFAARERQILTQPYEVWERMEQSLTRANNIVEGHYAERLWAALLSDQDERYSKEVDEALMPVAVDMVKRPTDGNVCGMAGMYFVKRNEPFLNYFPTTSALRTGKT